MQYKNIFIAVFVVALFVTFLFLIPKKHDIAEITSVQIGGQNVKVDLALTALAQEQGLSGRMSLAENQGMLFVFDTPGKYDFWMKDMNFPIDMIWLGEDMHIVYIKKDARPELYPETYGPSASDGNVKYVLEVSDGFADKNNLKVGDIAIFK
jgi:hypothetical protein